MIKLDEIIKETNVLYLDKAMEEPDTLTSLFYKSIADFIFMNYMKLREIKEDLYDKNNM